MQHQIHTVFQRTLQHWRAEGVVHHQDQAVLLRKRRGLGQVDQFEHRIGRGLGPDHPRVWFERRFHRVTVVQVNEAKVQSGRTPAHLFKQAIGTAVEVVHRNNMAARIQ